MKRRRYDPNPDVDEVLHYSGAGAAAVAKADAELDARLWEATREVDARALADWAAHERAERVANIRFFVLMALVMVAFALALWRLA